jgi:hypothetical protein
MARHNARGMNSTSDREGRDIVDGRIVTNQGSEDSGEETMIVRQVWLSFAD